MRRVLSWVLAILLCMSLLPGAAWAEEGPADKKESVHDINRQWGVIDLIDHSREDADESADDLSADDGCGCAALAALAIGIHYVSVADGTGAWNFVSATLEGALQQTLGQGGSKGPAITAQPADATAAEGSTAEFSVTATGAASYQWQFWSVKSEAWYSVTASDYTGLTAATMTVPATADRNGMKYRCAVTNEAGTVYSESATLTVG